MAYVLSSMMNIGEKAPDFKLLDVVSDKLVSLEDIRSEVATVVIFLCNHCAFVRHINGKLVELACEYQKLGVKFVAISSNDIDQYPEDAPIFMEQMARYHGYPFPYLYDALQDVAVAYGAESNPDIFVFDDNLQCTYTGRFDMTRPNIQKATGKDLCDALDAMLDGREVEDIQYPCIGSSIAWKRGLPVRDMFRRF